ncbi:MAG: 2-hydroxyacid dehydrogenase [Clostridiales bacterium]|nr:2-hydroxyacid dehydrogenase [Clostridiales bacterium]
MKIAFYDTKPYDKIWFEKINNEKYNYKIKFFEDKLNADTAVLAKGYDVACAFVNDVIDTQTINILNDVGVGLLAMRCAGYNNVDFKSAFDKLHVVRVPQYSPYAVAEHAMALLLGVNRKIFRAFNRTREGNFSINGLLGFDLFGKTAGVVGTGRIGRVFIDICKGFGMKVLAYDPFPAKIEDVKIVSLDELYKKSDIISLHCPLTKSTKHIINSESIQQMKQGAIIINTSRGGLINTLDLIEGLKSKQLGGAGLDVYEEESSYFFEDMSSDILEDDTLARLLTLHNVLVTAHQGFFTKEALESIANVTLENIKEFEENKMLTNEICYKCGKTDENCNRNRGKSCF